MEAICKVSLKAITQNYQYFQQRVAPAEVIPVVKANAYGHGAVRVAQHLHQTLEVNTFAVATLEEAQELAVIIPKSDILIFSRVFPGELSSVPENAILSIGSVEDGLALMHSATGRLKVHLNVNTGMNRLGLSPERAIQLIADNSHALDICGVYTHFSSSDTASTDTFNQQIQVFDKVVVELKRLGFQGMVHISNSAGALHDKLDFYDAMRLGIGLYGYDTSPLALHSHRLQPAMEVLAPLIRVESIHAGESVSYAEKWQAASDTNIGTLRIGYADGYSRALTNRGVVSFQGKSYQVVGTVTMDHIMIDLGQESPATGSMFTVLGGDATQVKIAHVAAMNATITYEICCAISPRVKREY